MGIRTVITPGRIEGLCAIPGRTGEQSVVVFSTIGDTWHTASSMCQPGDVSTTKIIIECMNAALDELSKHTQI